MSIPMSEDKKATKATPTDWVTEEALKEEIKKLSKPTMKEERKFTLDEMIACWNAGENRLWDEQFGVTPTKSPSKQQYFKEKFNIDL